MDRKIYVLKSRCKTDDDIKPEETSNFYYRYKKNTTLSTNAKFGHTDQFARSMQVRGQQQYVRINSEEEMNSGVFH